MLWESGDRLQKMTASIEEKRDRLIAEIEDDALRTESWTGRAAFSDRVMAAMAKVPRHKFVSNVKIPFAYINRPLPIGHGQTISQPYIVALMTDLLDLGESDRVLEIGTGSGYQAAVLGEVAGQVYSIEVVPPLAKAARTRLKRLGYENIEIKTGQGRKGWAEKAPFQAIIVTAASEDVPGPLVDQLAPGGRMVIPIGSPYGSQNLILILKGADGGIKEKLVLPVAFVPLVGHPEQ